MTGEEAEALFLAGLPGPAAELGLGTVVAAAQLKVLASLPPELRTRASRLVERFHLDAGDWFQASQPVPYLGALSDAVWNATRITHRLRPRGGLGAASPRAARARPQGRNLVRRGRHRRPDPHVSRVARRQRPNPATSTSSALPASTWRLTGPSRPPPTSARSRASRSTSGFARTVSTSSATRSATPSSTPPSTSPIPTRRAGYDFGCAWTGRTRRR